MKAVGRCLLLYQADVAEIYVLALISLDANDRKVALLIKIERVPDGVVAGRQGR